MMEKNFQDIAGLRNFPIFTKTFFDFYKIVFKIKKVKKKIGNLYFSYSIPLKFNL